LLGRKALRKCPVKGHRVVCDGLCKVVFSVVDVVHVCAVWEEAFDLALNG